MTQEKPESLRSTAQRLARATLGQGLATIWSALLGFFTAPFMIRHLGTTQYGVLALVAVVVSLVSNLEFGFGLAAIRFLSRARAADDRDAEQAVLSNSLLVFVLAAVCGGILVYFGASFIVRYFAHGPAEMHGTFLIAVQLAAPILAVSFLNSLFGSSLQALGRIQFLIGLNLASGTALSATSIAIVVLHGGLIDVLIGNLIIASFGAAVTLTVLAYTTTARLIPRLYRAKFVEMLRYSIHTLLAGIGSQLLGQGPPTVLAAYTTTSELASFSLPRTVLAQLDNLVASTSLGFMPFVSAESAGTEQHRVLAVYFSNMRLTLLTLIFPSCFLTAFAHPLLAAWISPSFAASAAWPLRWFACASLLWGLGAPPSDLARGWGRPQLVSAYTLGGSALTIGLTFLFVAHWHAAGAAAAICLGGAIMNLPYVFVVPRMIGHVPLTATAKMLAGPLSALVLTALLVCGGLLVADTLVGAIATGTIGLTIYLIFTSKIILSPVEKTAIMSVFNRSER